MLVRSVRGEIVNLELVKEFTLKDDILTIRDGERSKVFTLTKDSAKVLTEYLEERVK